MKRLYRKYKLKSVREFLRRSDEIGREIFEKYSNLFCGTGDFYKLDAIKKNIEKSNFKAKTKNLWRSLPNAPQSTAALTKP